MSKKGKADGAKAADGKAKKGKGRKAEGAAEPVSDLAIRVGAHPRARWSIRRVRAQAGIAGFVVTLLLAHQAGVPAFETLMRALAGGMVAHFATWAFAIALWRRLIVAELEAAREDLLARRAQAEADAAAGAAAGGYGTAVASGAPAL